MTRLPCSIRHLRGYHITITEYISQVWRLFYPIKTMRSKVKRRGKSGNCLFSFFFSRGNFNGSHLLYKLTKWPQLGLILKSRHSSLKWAQDELNCSIHLGATVLQSWYHFQTNNKNRYNFESFYLLNKLSYRALNGSIWKNLNCYLGSVSKGANDLCFHTWGKFHLFCPPSPKILIKAFGLNS